MPTMSPLRAALLLSLCALGACPRRDNRTPDVQAPPPPGNRPPAPDVTPSPPSADAVVLAPGEGVGAYSLGMTRAAARALAPGARVTSPRSLEADGFELLFDADEPAGEVTAVRVTLATAAGGVRVGNAVLQNTASYAEVISNLGACTAPETRIGATITACQGGGVKVLQVGPTQGLVLEVSR